HGTTSNPWNTKLTSGGSSGGAAAALAAGMSPLGLGSDLAGSIRLPAHYCGIYGLKPTDYRVSRAGHIPPLPGQVTTLYRMFTSGPLARSVADLRLALQLIAGPDERDTEVLPMALTHTPPKPLRELRVAWIDEIDGAPVTAETRAGIHNLVNRLTAAGCRVERAIPPDFDFDQAWRLYGQLIAYVIGVQLGIPARWVAKTGAPAAAMMRSFLPRGPFMSGVVSALNLSAYTYFTALTEREELARAMERFLSQYDAWICPVASGPAFPHCKSAPLGAPIRVDDKTVPYWTAAISYTSPLNLTGHPVVTMPLTQSADGLPIGVQLVGQLWGEMELLNVAETLSPLVGPVRRPPGC
ncbi:MAG: amidase, partial [Chloroflexi bacterium]|nr:amidase [Chloroflexota bacterium]